MVGSIFIKPKEAPMKLKVLEYIASFGWLALVFFGANYTNIPRRSTEYLVKTLPVLIVGLLFIWFWFDKYREKKKQIISKKSLQIFEDFLSYYFQC